MNKHKIVVLDGYTENPGDLSWAPLEALGELTVYDRTSYSESDLIAERIGDADIAVVNKTPVSAATMDKCPGLKAVFVLATGYNIVDVKYARSKGIDVVNVPTYGTQNVSQYAVSLLMEICSHIGHHDQAVKQGRWQSNVDWCFWDYPLVLAYDAFKSEAGAAVAEYVELDELLARSDVIFLHCPLFPETEGMINKENISKMRDGVILINNSRGPLVNEYDLAEALESGKVYAAAVDVVSTEPIEADNPLLTAKNCIITPHISWATKDARQRIMDITADNIRAWERGEPVNVVNK